MTLILVQVVFIEIRHWTPVCVDKTTNCFPEVKTTKRDAPFPSQASVGGQKLACLAPVRVGEKEADRVFSVHRQTATTCFFR